MMNEQDRNREEQLERLFRTAGPGSIPSLTPDPGLPARVRALAAAGATRDAGVRWWSPRWAWVPMAGAAVAVCILFGAYLGYRAAVELDPGYTGEEAEVLTAAWSQSGSVEELGTYDDEVME